MTAQSTTTTKTGRGIFICLEGGEGSGKTAMATAVATRLRELGRSVVEVADPGSTPLAKQIRKIVLDAAIPCDPSQQTLLYTAARAALAEEVARLLDNGTDVVVGRWTLSTLVYQGQLGHVGVDKVDWLNTNFVDLEPDIYILLDASPDLALKRKLAAVGSYEMEKDRFDSRGMDWHTAVRNAYFEYAESNGYPIINADQCIEEVAAAVWDVCTTHSMFHKLVK